MACLQTSDCKKWCAMSLAASITGTVKQFPSGSPACVTGVMSNWSSTCHKRCIPWMEHMQQPWFGRELRQGICQRTPQWLQPRSPSPCDSSLLCSTGPEIHCPSPSNTFCPTKPLRTLTKFTWIGPTALMAPFTRATQLIWNPCCFAAR